MYANAISPPLLKIQQFFMHGLVALVAAVLLVFAGISAHAAPPPAGTSISNQASATYSDASGVTRTVNSNIVQTTVTQVASFTLTANGAQNATAGSVVYYPHTLTNTGNGSDSFNLSTSNAGFTMTSVQIFADNGSGQPTGSAITSTGAVASNAQFRFVVVGTLSNTATLTNTITVTAASGFTPAITATNTDVTTVTSNAVITLTKAVSVASGAPGSGPFTYSLTYTNTGNSNATAVAISDVVPAGLTYIAGTARWSVTGAVTPIDTGVLIGAAPNQITASQAGGTFTATINSVAPGQSGIISFQFNVATPVAPGIRNNTATTSYNNGAATVTGASNTVPFNVTQSASVTMTPPAAIATAAPGSTISFSNTLTNTGSGTDSFNITVGTNNFPAGTTFQVFRSDGVTPMVDSNGDSIVDTGPVTAGATYAVVLRATLPPSATNVGAPFTVAKTATSVFDPTRFATATDTLTAVTAASVDLRNSAALGLGAGPEAGAVVTNTAAGGSTSNFTLLAYNTGASPDSYNLAAGSTAAMAALPAGWSVSFRAGSCAASGATVSNTGSIAGGAFGEVCAVVTVPAGALAATTDIYFRVLSPTSGATDVIHDAVTVNASRSLALSNPGTGQTYPGGIVVYPHTLTNTGNVLEGNGTVSTIALASSNSQSAAGWTSALYYDANNNGVLDATDPLITGNLNAVAGLGAGLVVGQSITVFDRVMAPSGALAGAVNSTTITVTTSNGSYTSTVPAILSVADGTTVIAGNLTLTKAQSLDIACSNAAPIYTSANLSARPNECVRYQITVTNVGTADATNVVLSDATPAFTTISTAAALTPAGSITQPALGAAGTVSATVGTLTPGASAVLTFSVRITP